MPPTRYTQALKHTCRLQMTQSLVSDALEVAEAARVIHAQRRTARTRRLLRIHLSCGSKPSFGGEIDGFGGCEKREVEDEAVSANPL